VLLDELLALHEHSARAAAGVVNTALVGRKHEHKHLNHASGRVELSAFLALGAGELGEEVLVDAAEDVFGALLLVTQADGANEVNQLAEALLVERGAGVVFGQNALQRLVVALNGNHRIVNDLAYSGLFGVGLEVRPPRLLRHPEDVLRSILVWILRVGTFRLFGNKPGVVLLKCVGDVLQEDETENDVLVLGGVHIVAELVCRLPELDLKAERCSIGAVLLFNCRRLASHVDAFFPACLSGRQAVSSKIPGVWPHRPRPFLEGKPQSSQVPGEMDGSVRSPIG